MNVSIVIPCYDGRVDTVFASIDRQTIGASCERVVTSHTSPAARARNLGAYQAKRDIIVFLDDDVQFSHERVLEDVVRALEACDDKSAVCVTWRLADTANWVQRKFAGEPALAPGTPEAITELPWMQCGTACFAVRASLFRKLGGFDESLISAEDCDLAYRITLEGGKIYTLPGCWIAHDPPRTIRGAIAKSLWYERGNAQFARKSPEAKYRIDLSSRTKAVAYLLARTLALIPLMFVRVSFHQRKPRFAFRPFEALISYVGAWAYVKEWLFPTRKPSSGMNGRER